MGSAKTILVIDDDPDFRASVVELLEGQGYSVLTAADGKDGLARAKADLPDIIILDIMMEHYWAGYEVNQAI